jgi:hypothetical protein
LAGETLISRPHEYWKPSSEKVHLTLLIDARSEAGKFSVHRCLKTHVNNQSPIKRQVEELFGTAKSCPPATSLTVTSIGVLREPEAAILGLQAHY